MVGDHVFLGMWKLVSADSPFGDGSGIKAQYPPLPSRTSRRGGNISWAALSDHNSQLNSGVANRLAGWDTGQFTRAQPRESGVVDV